MVVTKFERKRHVINLLKLTFHTRVIDSKACPIDIAIHCCQVIYIEIHWCSTWTIVSWLNLWKQAKTWGWFAFQAKWHYGFQSFSGSKFHICLTAGPGFQSMPVSNLYKQDKCKASIILCIDIPSLTTFTIFLSEFQKL